MLEIKEISKVYKTGDLEQTALDNISVNFRKCEFVSVLGPSGSGKTTLLNIIGGLDHSDSGELIINDISTKKYKSKNWDSYRNHRIGFVFQSYNLIKHQTILKNVELALILSGVSKKTRIKKAKQVLEKVGLKEHIHKKPNQLSGGQMQRVAIARALVNDPDIILADEPTGALDSKTSEQIMDILKEISKEKLVIMVTHNPALARRYSNRIIELKDGHITKDNNPYEKAKNEEPIKLKDKKTAMNLKTALSLSLNNLMTKKGRTFLTSFAGSIGIIGIALIISISRGVNEYIDKTERETLASYPLTIEAMTVDLNNMMNMKEGKNISCQDEHVCTTEDITNNHFLKMTSSVKQNNLANFKRVIDRNYMNIKDYVTDIQYMYDLDLQIYTPLKEGNYLKVNPSSLSFYDETLENKEQNNNQNVFNELIDNEELLKNQYDILQGRMPKKYNELVLVVDNKSQIPASLMYTLNYKSKDELNDIIKKIKNGEEVTLKSNNYSYDEILDNTYKLILNTDYYKKEQNTFKDYSNDINYLNKVIENGIDLKIVGIIKVKDDMNASSGYVGYTKNLKEYVIDRINESLIVKEQNEFKDIDVFTKKRFNGTDTSYEKNAQILGIRNLESPTSINIYPKDYLAKEKIEDIIKEYNKGVKEEFKITYTDYLKVILKSITSIVNVITYVLVFFVAISLVVSSIMISIITYISVLERTKEIGILKALGASKKDITRVFKSETMIEGFLAGGLGIFITVLLSFPINSLVKLLTNVSNIMSLPIKDYMILIMISVILTLISGLIPAKVASKKDPVWALRSE